MLRDEGGGWCDCGDRTAWREPYVYCTFHAPKYPTGPPPPAGYPPAGYPAAQPGYPAQPRKWSRILSDKKNIFY